MPSAVALSSLKPYFTPLALTDSSRLMSSKNLPVTTSDSVSALSGSPGRISSRIVSVSDLSSLCSATMALSQRVLFIAFSHEMSFWDPSARVKHRFDRIPTS